MLFDFIWSFEYSAGLDIYFFYPRQVTTIFTCLNINLACPKSFNSEESKVVFFLLVFVICFFCFTILIIFAPYFVRSMTLSITQMESRMIIMYFDAYDKIVDNKKVLWILVLYIHIYWNNFSHNVTKNYFSSRQVLGIFTCHNYFLHC